MEKDAKIIKTGSTSPIELEHYLTRKCSNETPKFTILLIKPYQNLRDNAYGPPLGLITLAQILINYYGSHASLHFLDMSLYKIPPEKILPYIERINPNYVAVSALNAETQSSFTIAEICNNWNKNCITILGGPIALRQSRIILDISKFDWVIEGPGDRVLPAAIEQHLQGNNEAAYQLPGFSFKRKTLTPHLCSTQDHLESLENVPLPAWSLIDFERYRKRDRKRIITNVSERKYAFIFTSRGCPYLCNYCHDIFTKKFVYRSSDSVISEMKLLYYKYDIREFHFIDDIFNLHRPRVREIMRRIKEEIPNDIYLAFPNGLRGDILDISTIEAMVAAGTYHATISIETVTERLQTLVQKNLNIQKAFWAIDEFAKRGVIVQGAFMLGFPTETKTEIKNTVSAAVRSRLTNAYFFAVIPQPSTPIYNLAMSESPNGTLSYTKDERDEGGYNSYEPWYSRAYNINLQRIITFSYLKFFLYPPRVFRLIRAYGLASCIRSSYFLLHRIGYAIIRRKNDATKQA